MGLAKTTSRIDSLESNKNAKCPLTVEIQLHRWAGILLLLGGELNANSIKRTSTTPQCCPMPLVTDFIVVRQPQTPMSCIAFGFYRCLPASSPYVLYQIGFRCQPHQRNDVHFPFKIIFNLHPNSNVSYRSLARRAYPMIYGKCGK